MSVVPDPTPAVANNNVTVGQAGFAYQLTLDNASTASAGAVRVDDRDAANTLGIYLTPSCGTIPPGANPPCTDLDPNVFSFGLTGTGSAQAGVTPPAGTGCVGTTFDLVPIGDAGGRIAFDPRTPVILAPNGQPGDVCIISFTSNVVRAPVKDAEPGIAGIQTGALAEVTISQVVGALNGGGDGSTELTVARSQPAITTQATNGTLGGSIGDTATVSGLVNPVTTGANAGTVTFRLYSDAACANLVYDSGPRPITYTSTTSGTATATYTPTAEGPYRWIASYSGDLNNDDVSGACGDANELSTVGPPPPPDSPPPPPPPATPPPPPEVCVPPPGPTPMAPGTVLCETPAQQVAAATTTTRGTARLIAPSGCVTRNFNVRVVGSKVRRVVFTLDGKRVKTLTRPNSGKHYVLAVRPNSLRKGAHRVTAVTSFTAASKTPSRTLRVVFSRCSRAAVAPRFTG